MRSISRQVSVAMALGSSLLSLRNGFDAARSMGFGGNMRTFCVEAGVDGVLALLLAQRRAELPLSVTGRGLRWDAGEFSQLPGQFEAARQEAQDMLHRLFEACLRADLPLKMQDLQWALGFIDDYGDPIDMATPQDLAECFASGARHTCRQLPVFLSSREYVDVRVPTNMDNTELLLRHGYCITDNPVESVGPLHLEVEDGDTLGEQKELMLALRQISTSHFLGDVGSDGQVAGLPEMVGCLRVLLCAESPLQSAPAMEDQPLLSEPSFDLDMLCLHTIAELLRDLTAATLEVDLDAFGKFSDAAGVWHQGQQRLLAAQSEAVEALLEKADRQPSAKRRRLSAELLRTSNELTEVVKLNRPTPADLEPYVQANKPVVLTGLQSNRQHGKSDFHPLRADVEWTDDHLVSRCKGRQIPVRCVGGLSRVFERETKTISMEKYVASLKEPSPQFYAAKVLLKDFPELLDDVAAPTQLGLDCLFGRPYFEGVIMYFGAGSQVTPLHFDQQENIMFVLRGSKHLRLYPPSDSERLYPGEYPKHLFSRIGTKEAFDDNEERQRSFPRFKEAEALEVSVTSGQALYLPYGWWHQVTGSPEVNLAVNYWFDVAPSKSELAAEARL
eukprot:TRINITY_DN40480_c0_g1_i1.p1 TRINITY_DN40480_c0_g1~~TRINITY_DN40480_c0_g1_i1.p1  ORF type:complete len:616 (+),score=103.11 TRINITY_DN40480_c0_g1_i1:18-1865(+)